MYNIWNSICNFGWTSQKSLPFQNLTIPNFREVHQSESIFYSTSSDQFLGFDCIIVKSIIKIQLCNTDTACLKQNFTQVISTNRSTIMHNMFQQVWNFCFPEIFSLLNKQQKSFYAVFEHFKLPTKNFPWFDVYYNTPQKRLTPLEALGRSLDTGETN